MKKVDNSVKVAGIVGVVLIVIAVIIVSAVLRVMPGETVTASGVAVVNVMPDLVSVYFNVETDGDTAAEAKDANAVIVDAVISALVAEGIARDEIVTEGFNVYEEYDWYMDRRTSIGFKATHRIKVELPADSDNIGAVVDAGVDNGALLSYINFELSHELQNKYKADALKLAAEDARVKADAIAEGLGARIGRVVSTSSSEFGYYPFLAYDSEDGVAVKGSEIQTEIQPGEREVNARISVTYKLK